MSAAKQPRTAVYTGVFDPVHLGHLDVIERGSKLFDRLVVGVGDNPDKAPFFSLDERVALVQQVVRPYANVEVRPFKGLAVQFVREVGARIILRGLRTTSDMEYEFNMSLANTALDPEIETVFLMAREAYSHVSGNLLRQIAIFGGPLHKFVPPEVKTALEKRVRDLQSQLEPRVKELQGKLNATADERH
jgi:pantetheine-phosphate adenylyltransferase